MDEIAPRQRRGSLLFFAMLGVSLFLVFVVTGFVAYLYHDSQQQHRLGVFQERLAEGRAKINEDTSGALVVFEEALADAENPYEESLALYNLGVATAFLDRAEGIIYFKEISENPIYPAKQRAWAINAVVIWALGVSDGDFFDEVVFTGPLWGTFIDKPIGSRQYADYMKGFTQAYDTSWSFYASYTAEYWLAHWEAKNADGSKEAVEAVRSHLRIGDILFDNPELAADLPADIIRLRGLTLKGMTLAYLSEKGVASGQEAVVPFQTAMQIVDATDDQNVISYGSFTRFYFASFLATVEGADNRKVIQTLLYPIAAADVGELVFHQFLIQQAAAAGGENYRDEITLVAHEDVAFKELLLKLGWKKSQLE
jgi:hypothetical protein